MRHALTDEQWAAIVELFPEPAVTGRPPMPARQALDGMIWLNNTGAKWRDIPESLGKWRTIYGWFDLWNANGTLQKVVDRLTQTVVADGRLSSELWCIDGTVVRAHRCAAGGGKKGMRANRPTMRSVALAGDLPRKSTCSPMRTGIRSDSI
jgi:transposase